MIQFNRRLLLAVSAVALVFSAPLNGHAMLNTANQPASQAQQNNASADNSFDPIAFVKRVIYPPQPPAKPKK